MIDVRVAVAMRHIAFQTNYKLFIKSDKLRRPLARQRLKVLHGNPGCYLSRAINRCVPPST